MKTLTSVIILFTIASFCSCHGPQTFGPVRKPVTLFGGLRRIANRAIVNVVSNAACNLICPLGTTCSLQLGTPQCIPRTINHINRAGVSYTNGYPLLSRTSGYSGLLGAFARRANRISRLGSMTPSVFLNHAPNTGLLNCGFVPPECRATNQHPSAAHKYTFDFTLNQCVQVNVCSACAFINGPQMNLFDNQLDCNRFCQ